MLQPLKGKIAVIPMFDPDSTGFKGIGGADIVMPESAKDRVDQGLVKYMGKEVTSEYGIKIGDHVIFSGYTGSLVKYDDELVIVLPAKYVTSIVQYDDEDFRIDGLFHKDENGEYFSANYASTLLMLALQIQQLPWYSEFNHSIKVPKPKPEEVDWTA